MVSSKDQAKKISREFRQLCKKFFEDFYAKADEAGRFPSPLGAAAALGEVLKRSTEGEWPLQTTVSPGVSTEVFNLVSSEFGQQAFHEAVESWYRHTPGLEIKKGKPGRPIDERAREYLARHSARESYSTIAQGELQSESEPPTDEAKRLLIEKERERIRQSVRRSRRRQGA
jgi:hypothetical protein